MNIDAVTVEVSKLELKPGDVLAIKCDRILSDQQRWHMKEFLEAELPGTKILVFDKGFDLEIITPG